MHPNPAFRQESESHALDFARERGFGVMTAAGPDGVLAAHIPFVMEERLLAAHLVRSNPLTRHLRDGEKPALLIVSGPDAYISPDWYGELDRVPTWNYVAVHLRGTLRLIEEERLRTHLDRLSANFEGRLLPKKLWKTDKMTPDLLAKMMRQIVPAEFTIEHVDSTFKFGQNRGVGQMLGAAAGLEAGGTPGSETLALAALMRAAADARAGDA
jgi:transcriptional regulator